MSEQRIHKIYTGVYTKKAYDILMRMRYYCIKKYFGDIVRDFHLALPVIEPNNEISWKIQLPPNVDNNTSNIEKFKIKLHPFHISFYNEIGISNTKEIVYWLGQNLKRLVIRELKKIILNGTIKTMKCLYHFLENLMI